MRRVVDLLAGKEIVATVGLTDDGFSFRSERKDLRLAWRAFERDGFDHIVSGPDPAQPNATLSATRRVRLKLTRDTVGAAISELCERFGLDPEPRAP